MPVRSVIEVDKLNVAYGEFHAVKDLSFRIARGELYALFGANGAGTSSTLEVIEGNRTASAGTVCVFGKSPTDRREVRPSARRLGYRADRQRLERRGSAGRLPAPAGSGPGPGDGGDCAGRADVPLGARR
ncbi:ATP-binding cassette domain-containing protein [Micromonospora parva]|uniref:ATP-binding cassette domain-containing protein n=1 Tax=Micromonospora parva TaxID=1464048 RepID=UPI0033C512BA